MAPTNENNIKYKRKDTEGGYLFNKDEIAYFKQMQNADVVDNLMVGDFNMVGTYVIDKPILEELVSLNKVFLYEFSQTYFCESLNKIGEFGKLKFAVKIQPNTPKIGTKTAILQLLEPIQKVKGYIENTNIVFLATFMDIDSPDYNDKMFNRFHIFKIEDAGKVLKEDQSSYQEILDRKRYLQNLRKVMNPTIERFNKDLFEKRMKIILKSPNAKSILEDLNKKIFEVDGVFIKKNDLGYYKNLNQILDSVLDIHDAELKSNPTLHNELLNVSKEFVLGTEKISGNSSIILANKKQQAIQDKVKNSAGSVKEVEKSWASDFRVGESNGEKRGGNSGGKDAGKDNTANVKKPANENKKSAETSTVVVPKQEELKSDFNSQKQKEIKEIIDKKTTKKSGLYSLSSIVKEQFSQKKKVNLTTKKTLSSFNAIKEEEPTNEMR